MLECIEMYWNIFACVGMYWNALQTFTGCSSISSLQIHLLHKSTQKAKKTFPTAITDNDATVGITHIE